MLGGQGDYPNDLAEMVAWVRGAAAPSMRVLEIGCGDGALTGRLADSGVDVLGVDPEAEPGTHVKVVAFEDLDAAPFDVLVASVSLHHLPDPRRATAALSRLTKPGSVVLVREFDRALLDHEPTLRWWFHQRHAELAIEPGTPGRGHDSAHAHGPEAELPERFEDFVVGWREQMATLLPWSVVRDLLGGAGFAVEEEWAEPYLYRWGLREAVRPLEEQLIAAGRINAVGIRWRGRCGG